MTHARRSPVRLIGAVGLLVASSLLAPVAVAKDEFPGVIAGHLRAPTNPPCGICHQYGKTGPATLVTPFAWSMRARGMTDTATLIPALDRVAADKVDSDGDGALDVDEIVAASDPNSPDSTPAHPGTVGDPKLGCAVGGDVRAGTLSWLLVVGSALCLVARARRRGRDESR